MAQYEAEKEIAAALKHQADLQDRLRQIRENKATTTGGASATQMRVAAAQTHAALLKASTLSLRSSLRNRKDLFDGFLHLDVLRCARNSSSRGWLHPY